MGIERRRPLSELEDDGARALQHAAMYAPQVLFEERIGIEEPEGRPQEREMRGAGGAQPCELADGVRIVGGQTEVLSCFSTKGTPDLYNPSRLPLRYLDAEPLRSYAIWKTTTRSFRTTQRCRACNSVIKPA